MTTKQREEMRKISVGISFEPEILTALDAERAGTPRSAHVVRLLREHYDKNKGDGGTDGDSKGGSDSNASTRHESRPTGDRSLCSSEDSNSLPAKRGKVT